MWSLSCTGRSSIVWRRWGIRSRIGVIGGLCGGFVFEGCVGVRWLCMLISPLWTVQHGFSLLFPYITNAMPKCLSYCTSLQWTLSSQTMVPRAEGGVAVKALPLTRKPNARRQTMLQPSFVKTTSKPNEQSRATRCLL
jgi:hypothetical protein